MKNIDSDLIRGNIDTIILTTMLDGDKYGLDIIKEVEIRSNGTYELKQPTLYSCLKRLENQELISSYWLDSDIGGRRHYYKLTEKGKESLLQKQEEWAKSKFIIDNLLSNHDFEEYRLVKKEDYDRIIEGKQFEYTPEKEVSSTTPSNDNILPEEKSDESEDEIILDENVNHFENLEDAPELENEYPIDILDEEESENDFEEDSIQEDEESIENENLYVLNENAASETRVDYNDDSDDAEADYPNQKRFKIPSIYDKITIDGESDCDAETSEDDEVEDLTDEDESDEVLSIYSDFENEGSEVEENESEEESLYDDFDLGADSETDEEDSSPVYYSHYDEPAADEDDDLNIPISQPVDQSQNELNILSRLRMQQDEEINEYVGDKNSYINHLNQNDEIESLKSEDLNVVQEDLLSAGYLSQSSIDSKINEFNSAIEKLNKFTSDSGEIENAIEDDEIIENDDIELEEELINDTNSHEESEDIIEFKENTQETLEDFDSYLDELKELEDTENNGFFNSLDSADYAQNRIQNDFKPSDFKPITFDSLDDFDENDSSDAAFEKQIENYNNQYGYNQSVSYDEESLNKSVQEIDDDTASEISDFASFDEIISRSATEYTNNTTNYMPSEEYQSFTPRFTENNYKQKLNNLSAYSKVNVDEPVQEPTESSEEIMNKVKDIQTLRAEFAEEGICVKEYKKTNGHDDVDRTYLLVNKINLVKSLILLFGYVFVLSAIYIIMNNTSASSIHNFSFKYFLYGFIPFGIYALYHTVMFVISPYKKIPAKFAPRIMIFISVIITIQLLLITYCVNLQLGFYSFSQSHYNHLIWVIPTIISFAPIISNLIYMTLYYSKNFNV